MKSLKIFIPALILFLIVHASTFAIISNDNEKQILELNEWLQLGPIQTVLPVYHDVENIQGSTFSTTNLLHFGHVDISSLRPVFGEQFTYNSNHVLRWSRAETGSGTLSMDKPDSENQFHVYYLATYLRTDRWAEFSLKLEGNHAFSLYINGSRAGSKTTVQSEEDEPGSLSENLKLERGHHHIIVKYMVSHEGEAPVFSASLEYDESLGGALHVLDSPKSPLSLKHLMDSPQPSNVSISPDGSLAAIMMRQSRPDDNTWESWIELVKADSGEPVATYRGGMQFSGMNWAPTGRVFSYTTRSSGKGTIWVVDLDRGTHEPVLRDVERLGGHTWAPDASYLLYSVSEQQQRDASGVSRLDGMHDRYPTWRNRSFIYRLNLPAGTQERLTAGILTTSLNSISPDGNKLVYSRTHVDYSERPFTRAELILLDLQTMEPEVLFDAPWVGGAQFSPDGRSLLLTGSPNAFDDAGRTVDGLANDYDSQAYIYDLENRVPRSITRELDPAVGSATWSHDGRYVYVTTTDRSFSNVYRIDVRNNRIARMDTGVDMTSGWSVAEKADRAAYVGHGINDPHKVYFMDLRRERHSLISNPSAEVYNDVYFGTAKDWITTTNDGTEIDGHVYYPVDFDPSKKYPVIVYYYGGTSPVSRAFSGRYPKELYAAHGYIVYVLQPSGATGFGQEFSQRHLNDWGIRVSGEIIQSVGNFLDAHEYADRERVGAIGASYGGFMTMLLLTQTDLFATAISHAGISNITSYWGEGFWGYLYSSVASANSYPWDAPGIYVEQSPIFHADKVNTPLLLLHGMSDTNVPPGESIQFYTALKLLGKKVEFVQIQNQDHHIVDYDKFILWKNTIVSWFDRWLKDEPAWWDELYD